MAVQVHPGARGLAIGVLCYSFISLFVGFLLAWLVWVHRQRRSFIFFLAIATCIATSACIAQQIHTIIWWRDIKLKQHIYWVENYGKPEIYLAGALYGVDLVLLYIQFACYNIAALLILFWSATLLRSVFQLQDWKPRSKVLGLLVRLLPVIIPSIVLPMLALPSVQHDTVAFLIVANCCMGIGLVGSAVALFVIFGRYLYVRRQSLTWNVRYGESSCMSRGRDEESTKISLPHRQSIYDRWLLTRFTLGFVVLAAFEAIIIKAQLDEAREDKHEILRPSADLSLSTAESEFLWFIPASSPPVALFLMFGTTAPFRKYIWDKIVPSCLRRKTESKKECSGSLEHHRVLSHPHDLHTYSYEGGSLGDGEVGRVGTSLSWGEYEETPILRHPNETGGAHTRSSTSLRVFAPNRQT